MNEWRQIHSMNNRHFLQPEYDWLNCLRAYAQHSQAAIDLKTALYSTLITLHFNSSGADRFRRA